MQNRIVFVGAGSTVFSLTLLKDICSYETLNNISIVLYDIDAQRLEVTLKVAQQLVAQINPARAITIGATLNRDHALHNATFVLTMFQIGGYEPATVADFEIPKKYGLQQTIGDTVGIGGIMRGLRTIPALLEVCAAMQRWCPDALLMNYANPMAMNCWAIAQAGNVRSVGLCHSIPITTEQLAADLCIPVDEIDYTVAGINHLAFYLKLERKGVDLYPALHAFMQSTRFPPQRKWGTKPMVDRVRYEFMRRFGYFVTESSEHFSEYVPWFIKRSHPELIARLQIPLNEYPRRCQEQIAEWESLRTRLFNQHAPQITRSNDYGARVIESTINNRRRTVYCNLQNTGAIPNLPHHAVVEIPCTVAGNTIQPVHIGAIPPQLAALMHTNIGVQELTVRAALEKNREYVYHAAMLDPHTAAELSIDEIYRMVDELLDAHRPYLPFK